MKGRYFFYVARSVIILLYVSLFNPSNGQIADVNHWESLVIASQEWKYFPGTKEPPQNWKDVTFNDDSWRSGKGGIGYGDGDDRTVINPVLSLYMRRKFNLEDTSKISALVFHMDYDDAFVAYINGREIARSNIGTPGVSPTYNTPSSGLHEALMYQGQIPEEYKITVKLMVEILVPGENVLAVQVHNQSVTSSDLSSIPFLSVGINDDSFTYMQTPGWFVPPKDYSESVLPIIVINTLGQIIDYEERHRMEMGVIDHGPGEINNIEDDYTGYHGWINIEIRGESTQSFPKKAYGFETQDSIGQNNNVPLLGLPQENDWILYAPYSDKSLIRNVLTYKLTRDMGRYATRTRYCELFINGKYEGIYVLMEKIKRDINRVDISNLRYDDIYGDQLTGGYILRMDKIDDNDYPPWESRPSPSLPGAKTISFQFFDPGGDELRFEQQNYIMEFIFRFESTLSSHNYLDPFTGYHKYVDLPSFADYLIINELTKEVDSYLFSTYMYKDRNSKGGTLHMGPVWDFNLGYANVDYYDNGVEIPGWVYEDGWRMYWLRRMMEDFKFRNILNCRWHSLREDIFRDDRIMDYIDSLASAIEIPATKNFHRWPVLGVYVWPNYFIGNTFYEEIEFLKSWLFDRLQWMDDNIPNTCTLGLDDDFDFSDFVMYPNPFYNYLKIHLGENWHEVSSISVYDMQGRHIYLSDEIHGQDQIIHFDRSDLQNRKFPQGLYLITIELKNGTRFSRKLIKKLQ